MTLLRRLWALGLGVRVACKEVCLLLKGEVEGPRTSGFISVKLRLPKFTTHCKPLPPHILAGKGSGCRCLGSAPKP